MQCRSGRLFRRQGGLDVDGAEQAVNRVAHQHDKAIVAVVLVLDHEAGDTIIRSRIPAKLLVEEGVGGPDNAVGDALRRPDRD
jgi:hypothetical protein